MAGVENGAMLSLTTHLFRYTPECAISWSNFQNFLRLGWQGGIDPLTKILRTPLTTATATPLRCTEERPVIMCTFSGGFKEWLLVQWPTRPLSYGPRRPLVKIKKKFALQLPKQDFYSFKRSIDSLADEAF